MCYLNGVLCVWPVYLYRVRVLAMFYRLTTMNSDSLCDFILSLQHYNGYQYNGYHISYMVVSGQIYRHYLILLKHCYHICNSEFHSCWFSAVHLMGYIYSVIWYYCYLCMQNVYCAQYADFIYAILWTLPSILYPIMQWAQLNYQFLLTNYTK